MDEVKPPWVVYPGFGPGDFFWRDAGQPWFVYVWEPYFKALSENSKEAYKARWLVPQEWEDFYFDADWQAFLHSEDEE